MNTKLHIAVVSIIIFLLPQVHFAQSAPDLGACSSFALFTAAGAFSNQGASTVVTGDVGTNVGAFSAFPPGILIGQIHVADPTTAQAATDIDHAYGYVSTITCGSVISTTMGGGQMLLPNVYCLEAASTINGDLILDGQGDPTSLFIFKIDGALATTVGSRVLLTNSASICNVFWQVNGEVDLGDNSLFQGTILANGAINLLEGATLYGRGLSKAGAISLHNNIVTVVLQPTADTISASGATTFCAGDSVTLSGNVDGVWNTGATASSITVNTDGDYFVTNTNGCGSDTSNHIVVTVNQCACTLSLSFTCTKPLCVGDANGSINIIASGAQGNVTYIWNDGITTEDRTNLAAGTYTVTATDAQGCTAILTETITQAPALVITETHTNVSGHIPGSIDITATGGSGRKTYLWSDGAITQDRKRLHAGTYTVTATDKHGCSASATVVITQTSGKESFEETISGAINIYPNPVEDNFTIELVVSDNDEIKVTVTVENLLGQIVYRSEAQTFYGNVHMQIALGHSVPSGQYALHVIANNKEFTRQFIVQHPK